MNARHSVLRVGLLMTMLLIGSLTACARSAVLGGAASPPAEPQFFAEEAAAEMEAPAPAEAAGDFAGEGSFVDETGRTFDQQGNVTDERLIIRTGSLSLIVDDTLQTMDAIGQMANTMGGFVVTSNSYESFEESYSGSISIRVPAERFDEAMDTIKSMAVEVSNETVSGQDVTEEFVDLQARVENLKAAEEELRQIMENAQDTEDVLAVYNQLVQTRGEIESLEGRMKYLSESARLSTISVDLTPNIVTQPVDVRWKPLETLKLALERLGQTMADVVDFLINFIIVVVPTLLVIGVVLGAVLSPFYFVGRALLRRRRRRKQQGGGN